MKTHQILGLKCDDLYRTVEDVYWHRPTTPMDYGQMIVDATRGERVFSFADGELPYACRLTKRTSQIYFTGRLDLMVAVVATGDAPAMVKIRRFKKDVATCPLADFETIHDVVKWTRMVGSVLARTGEEQT